MTKLSAEVGACVHIKWLDSAILSHGWSYDTLEVKPKEIETVGFIKGISDKAVLVAHTQSNSGGCVGNMVIPTGCIVKIKTLEV